MKILIIIIATIQILIDIWCISGVWDNTQTLKRILEIMELEKEVGQKNE